MGIVHALLNWLKAPEQASLRRAFAVGFGRVFLPRRLPGTTFEPLSDLHEVHHMLAENTDSWADAWKREGLQQGLQQGREQGREQGRRQSTRHLLIRLARRRFGDAIATQAEPLVSAIDDLQQLEELGDLLLTSPNGEAWLQALRQR